MSLIHKCTPHYTLNIQSKTSEIKLFPYLGLYYKYKPNRYTQE